MGSTRVPNLRFGLVGGTSQPPGVGMPEGTPTTIDDSGRLAFLDGIRGLASLWVLVGHCMLFGGWFWAKLPEPIVAVDVFMFVSGYLMVHQWNRREGVGGDFGSGAVIEFWIRRFFRIAPVYYLVLAGMFAGWPWLAEGFKALQAANPERWASQQAFDPEAWETGLGAVAMRASFLFGLVPSYAVASFTGDWSLSLEMQFYAAFPLLLWALRRWGPARVSVVAVLCAFAIRELTLRLQAHFPGTAWIFPLPSFLPLKLPVFLVGMLVAETNRRFAAGPGPGALDLALALGMASLSSWHVVVVAGMAFFLAAPIPDPTDGIRRWRRRLAWALGNRGMKALADASYAVYLFHSLVLPLLGGWLLQQGWFESLANRSRVLVLIFGVAGITYPMAWIVHYALERPGIAWGRRLARRWRNSCVDAPRVGA
jgi:peptidoglycan/LPS O-acetylase OafA/YrhL